MEEEQTEELEPGQVLAEERARAEQLIENLKRTQADFINYKRRSQQEISETSKVTRCALILEILPVLDDLERALEAVPESYKNQSWVEGVSLIERKFKTVLESQGVCAIEALGQPFDPRLHEARLHQPGEEGVVVAELQRGYRLDDKIIRPSGVAVGSGEEEETAENEKES